MVEATLLRWHRFKFLTSWLCFRPKAGGAHFLDRGNVYLFFWPHPCLWKFFESRTWEGGGGASAACYKQRRVDATELRYFRVQSLGLMCGFPVEARWTQIEELKLMKDKPLWQVLTPMQLHCDLSINAWVNSYGVFLNQS